MSFTLALTLEEYTAQESALKVALANAMNIDGLTQAAVTFTVMGASVSVAASIDVTGLADPTTTAQMLSTGMCASSDALQQALADELPAGLAAGLSVLSIDAAPTVVLELNSMPENPRQCVASHIKKEAKLNIRSYMEFYVATVFFFIYTLHYFTGLIQDPKYVTLCRLIYIVALLAETAIYQSAFFKIRQIFYSGPSLLPSYSGAPKKTTGQWNWNLVCSDELGVGNPTWASGMSMYERSRDDAFQAALPYVYAQPQTGATLTEWGSDESCSAYLLYHHSPFRQLEVDLWYQCATLRSVVAILYILFFVLSFTGVGLPSRCRKGGAKVGAPGIDAKDGRQAKHDRMKNRHSQKLQYSLGVQRFFFVVEVMYNWVFTVLVSSLGISVLWFYYAESEDPLTFSYLSSGSCDDVAGQLVSSRLGQESLRCMKEVISQKQREDGSSYFVVYQSVLIFYVLTIVESIHFVEEHDKEFNKNRMEWDTMFRWLAGMVLFLECILFFVGIVNISNQDPEGWFTDEIGPLENNYPAANRLNLLSYSAIALRISFLLLYTIAYAFVIMRCWWRMSKEHEIDVFIAGDGEAKKDFRSAFMMAVKKTQANAKDPPPTDGRRQRTDADAD